MTITAQQNAFFEAYFAIKPAPCIKDIVALGALTGIRVNDISIWFRRRQLLENRRPQRQERTSESELEEQSMEQLQREHEALWARIAESHRAIVNRMGIEEQ
ncbi:hypothetical protein GCK72_006905 [Caenorhabditis remanei]|uniref:Homeobox domain-containing protein n=1 Tax=Caenorhabditis remanei TaxID=31234 RepID=A0A6A5HK38_CAERE|nr:hypothetical protein GCK72_006905 [Caenorhabditis remanei]KAF1766947.1 hypothetical protein GCK72_006905 [Caenorhabditis remanei]